MRPGWRSSMLSGGRSDSALVQRALDPASPLLGAGDRGRPGPRRLRLRGGVDAGGRGRADLALHRLARERDDPAQGLHLRADELHAARGGKSDRRRPDRCDGRRPPGGVAKDGWELLRSKTVKLIDGRVPQWGTSEVMLGRGTRGRYRGAELGQSISIARRQWQVVGVFDADGSGFESEIWADVDQIADAAHRIGYSTMTAHLKSPS